MAATMVNTKIESKTINYKHFNRYTRMLKSSRRKYLALNDCIYFGEKYIRPYMEGWNSNTCQFHYEMIEALEAYEFLQVHVPYDHAKTTWISIVYPLWLITRDVSTQILLVSATPKLVQECLSVISWHLTRNQMLLVDFPYLKQGKQIEKWTDTQIYIKRKAISKDPTVEITGMGGAILGGKFNRIIGDDICDRNNMNSQQLRDKAEDWWLQDVHSRLTVNGKIANIGTLQHPDDLGVRLSANPKYYYIHKSAIIDEAKGEVLRKEIH